MVDPKLLQGLSDYEKAEALKAEEIARRAEERAERRALERAQRERQEQREKEKQQEQQSIAMTKKNGSSNIVFVRKKDRKKQQEKTKMKTTTTATNETTTTVSKASSASSAIPKQTIESAWSEKEREEIEQTYLGTSTQRKKKKQKVSKNNNNKKLMFKFQWDDHDDTAAGITDHLYAAPLTTKIAAEASRINNKKRKGDYLTTYNNSRGGRSNARIDVWNKPWSEMTQRDWRIIREAYDIVVKSGGSLPPPLRKWHETTNTTTTSSSSEQYPPMIHPILLKSIRHVLRFKEPSPIQRQGIPIGLAKRDFVGLAETGSGKTIAFGVPLAHYILELPPNILTRVDDHGPLGIVLAPTRELALQIEVELSKLLYYASPDNQGNAATTIIKTVAIVGGQSIQRQAQSLREGVHIVVGTPGRINDCLEMAYLVLNQCWYVVLDEADRMVDMGFAPQIESILDAMGGGGSTTKTSNVVPSNDNNNATTTTATGSTEDKNQKLLNHRVTAMFSATMPPEVERMAQTYLRSPAAIISIGDSSSRKNARIVQRLVYVSSPLQKEKALRDLLLKTSSHGNSRNHNEKIIIFCNEKKQADAVGRFIEQKIIHYERQQRYSSVVVLHGGKSQEQRQANLKMFREQRNVILVATDVAGRGLDIPNVSHVINYDLPPRSNIDSYSHRIGRTGRAGNQGLATSLWTDQDEGILGPLKQYLQATNQPIPDKLARHKAVHNF